MWVTVLEIKTKIQKYLLIGENYFSKKLGRVVLFCIFANLFV